MRNVYRDYKERNFDPYFDEDFLTKHVNLSASPNRKSAYEFGKSLSRISFAQLTARNANKEVTSTSVNSVLLDGPDRQLFALMWEVERRQAEFRTEHEKGQATGKTKKDDQAPYHSWKQYQFSTTKNKGGRQSKDYFSRISYVVSERMVNGERRFVIVHAEWG